MAYIIDLIPHPTTQHRPLLASFKGRVSSRMPVLYREKKREMGRFSSEMVSGDYGRSGPNPSEQETLELAEHAANNPATGSLENGDSWLKNGSKLKKKKSQVLLEGYVETSDEDELGRTKSLTDDDLDELRGCLDLGFGFSYDEIPELCNTLPALELCYSMSQKFLDEHQKLPDSSPSASVAAETCSSAASPIANWKISSPGDHPEDVKARLKFWAQAVACTVRLCN